MAVDSTERNAADCYQIVSASTHFRLDRFSQIAQGSIAAANISIAVSQPYSAVALLNRQGMMVLVALMMAGQIHIKSKGESLRFLANKSLQVNPRDPISMSFDRTGGKLLRLDQHVIPSFGAADH